MSCMWRQVVTIIRLYWIWSEVSADGEIFHRNVTLTWNEARKYCESEGKVLFNLHNNESEASLRKILKDTNQAWVSARVAFSHFVKVPVCMGKNQQFGPNDSFDTDIIYNCLKLCSGQLYAGLKDRDCYCFNDSTKLTRSMSCNSTCNSDPFNQCGGNDSMSLFEKVDKNITQHIVHGCKECVYARSVRGDIKLYTESCLGYGAHSAICKEGKDAACRENSWTVGNEQLCRMARFDSLRWKQAMRFCANIGGHLISSKIPSSFLSNNLTYWLGFYRIPMIHKVHEPITLEVDTNDTCCAVARREGDLMLIEGDDCGAMHAIICQDDGTKPIPGEGSNTETTDDKIIVGVVAVFAVVIVA